MSKQTITYVLVAVVLVLGSVVGYNYYQEQQATKTQASAREFLAEIPVNDITQINLGKKDGTVQLVKQNDSWVVASDNNTPADSTAITALLTALNHATVQAVIGQEATTDIAKFGLSQNDRLDITLQVGDKIVTDVIIGKIGAVPQTFYAQKMGEGTIYLINGARYELDKPDWKQPANPDDGQVTNVSVPVTATPEL